MSARADCCFMKGGQTTEIEIDGGSERVGESRGIDGGGGEWRRVRGRDRRRWGE